MSRRARGFAMPTVIIVVVVFASILGAALVTISSSQHVGFGIDLEGVGRTARPAPVWNGACITFCGRDSAAAPASRTSRWCSPAIFPGFGPRLPAGPTWYTDPEGGVNVNMYAITATACNANDCTVGSTAVGYVNRAASGSIVRSEKNH